MALSKHVVPTRKVLRNPFPESTRRGLKYTLHGGKEDHQKARERHKEKWTAVTLPRAVVEDLHAVASRDGKPLSRWLVDHLSDYVAKRKETLRKED